MSDDLRPGFEPVQGYALVERLGRGGFGEVWKAVGPGGFPVALKFVRLEESAGPVELRALEVIKHIRHPHLLGTFGSWRDGERLVIAMELADRTLLDRLREAAGQGFAGIPAPEVFEHFLDAAKALDFLNEPRHPVGEGGPQGIQHRDVKPQNLLLVGGSVKVADFGLAKVLEDSSSGHSGSMTPSYAAPEFFDRKTSSQSDQYSLAVTYCHLRGGRLPFEGNPAVVMAGHLMREPDLSMLPEAERPAVARALAKSPRDRWPSCRAFVKAVMESAGVAVAVPVGTLLDAPPTTEPVESAGGEPTPTRPTDPPAGRPRLRKRSVYTLGAWSLVAVGLLASTTAFFRVGRDDVASSPGAKPVSPRFPVMPSSPKASSRNPDPAASPSPAPGEEGDARASIRKGFDFLGRAYYDRAIAAFDEAIRERPEGSLGYAGRCLARALSYRVGGPGLEKQRDLARADGAEAIRLQPGSAAALAARAMTRILGRPDFDAALEDCDRAAQIAPELPWPHVAKGHILLQRGTREKRPDAFRGAARNANLALAVDDKLVVAYLLRADARRGFENYDAASEDLDAAGKIDPGNPMVLLARAMILKAQGQDGPAIRNLTRAILIAPNLLPAYRQRAALLDGAGEKARAEADRTEVGRLIGELAR